MKNYFTMIIALMALAGCASQIMAGYVGKTLVEPVLDHGPPTYSLEMGDGTQAFAWAMTHETTMPGQVTTTGNVYGTGSAYGGVYTGNANVYSRTTVTPPQTFTTDCNYVLYAEATSKKPSGPKDWVVTGFRKPSFDCE